MLPLESLVVTVMVPFALMVSEVVSADDVDAEDEEEEDDALLVSEVPVLNRLETDVPETPEMDEDMWITP